MEINEKLKFEDEVQKLCTEFSSSHQVSIELEVKIENINGELRVGKVFRVY